MLQSTACILLLLICATNLAAAADDILRSPFPHGPSRRQQPHKGTRPSQPCPLPSGSALPAFSESSQSSGARIATSTSAESASSPPPASTTAIVLIIGDSESSSSDTTSTIIRTASPESIETQEGSLASIAGTSPLIYNATTTIISSWNLSSATEALSPHNHKTATKSSFAWSSNVSLLVGSTSHFSYNSISQTRDSSTPLTTAPPSLYDPTEITEISGSPATPSNNSSYLYISTETDSSHRPSGTPQASPRNICSGATLNILNASLDWWFTKTYTQIESTLVVQYNPDYRSTGWTVLPASTTLNITSAVADPTCISSTALNPVAGQTMLQYSCWDTPAPVAAATTTVEQTNFKSLTTTSGEGPIPDIVTHPTSQAALTIGNLMTKITSGGPSVHFSKYEVVSKYQNRHSNGTPYCAETTKIHNMSSMAAFEYGSEIDVNGTDAANDGVVGGLPFALLEALGQETAIPGSFSAHPTVAIVVEKVIAVATPSSDQLMSSEGILDTPTPTLPSGLSYVQTTPTDTGIIWMRLLPRIEQTEAMLDVPTRTNWKAQTTDPGRGGSPKHIGSGIIIPSPTNALDVLTQAELTYYQGHEAGPATASVLNMLIPSIGSSEIIHGNGQGGSNGNSGNNGNLNDSPSNDTQPGGFSDSGNGNIWVDDTQPGPVLTIGTKVFTGSMVQESTPAGIVIGDQTVRAGGVPVTVSGIKISLAPGGTFIVIGSSTASLTAATLQPLHVLRIGPYVLTGSVIRGQTAYGIVIAGQTVYAGGPTVTIDGRRVSLLPGATDIVIETSTLAITSKSANPGAVANIPLVTIGPKVFTANAASQYKIGGSTLTPGGVIVFSGTTLSLAPEATDVVINGETQPLSAPVVTPAPLLTLEGVAYKANLGSTYDIGRELLSPGGVITASGSTISLAADGSRIVINGETRMIISQGLESRAHATITAPPVLTIDGRVYSADGGTTYLISDQTLAPGRAITFGVLNDQKTISLNSAAEKLVTIIDGITRTSNIGVVGAAPSGAPVLTVYDKPHEAAIYDPGSGATYIIDGHTLTPGGFITLTGPRGVETISLVPAGTAIVAIRSGSLTTSQLTGAYGVLPTIPPVLAVAGHAYTAINNGATYVIDGKTLTPGDAETVTVDGRAYSLSLAPLATRLDIGLVGADGKVASADSEVLFPATVMACSTPKNTASATARASDISSATGLGDSDVSTGETSASVVIGAAAALIAISSFALAAWL